MPSKEEKLRRRQVVRELAASQQEREEAVMPLAKAHLRDLLEHLEETLFEHRADGVIWCYCDHTLNRTRAFLAERRLPEEPIVEWLEEYGGYCDCEVSANVGGVWAGRIETA